MTNLDRVWRQQLRYNMGIKKYVAPDTTYEEWAVHYLTGLVSETSELLELLDWKHHRKSDLKVDDVSIALELADITKYALCLWQQFGFSTEHMLNFIYAKGEMLQFKQAQEHATMPYGKKVLIADMDGTLADWRQGFLDFLVDQNYIPSLLSKDPELSLSMDLDMGWPYSIYLRWKDQFELEGGYGELPAYEDSLYFFRHCRADYRIIVTARPVTIPRVYFDTFFWLKRMVVLPDAIHLLGDERIQLAMQLKNTNNNEVLMLEDNPSIALRAARNRIPVLMRATGYNSGYEHPLIHRVQSFKGLEDLVWTS